MKNKVIILGVIVFLIVLQESLLPVIFSGQVVPNLLLALVIATVITFGFQKTWPWVVSGGILADVYFYNRPGISVLIFILVAYLASFFSKRFLVENRGLGWITLSGVVFLATLVQCFFLALAVYSGKLAEIWEQKEFFLGVVFQQALYNLLFCWGMWLMLKKVKSSFLPAEARLQIK